MKKIFSALMISFTLSACGGGGFNYSGEEKIKTADVVLAPPPAANQSSQALKLVSPKTANPADVEKKIIKEGDINFETGNVNDTREQILSSLKKLGGYVNEDRETTNGDADRKQFTLSIKVPAQNFEAFLSNVASSATKINSRNIQVRDVTTEYIDVKTRLDNKKLLEKRYLSLLDKAGKMSDVLEIENKLTDIRSDIESTQGQLNYLDKQVSYSSLDITFYTKQAGQVDAGNGFGYKLLEALSNGFLLLQGLFFGFISFWPVWLVIFILYFVIRSWRKRKAKA